MENKIDIRLAMEQAAGNEQLAKELFQMLLAELPELLGKLKTAIVANDRQAMWDHAHKIHGSTAYCGVPALRGVIAEMEILIKAGDNENIENQLHRVDTEIQRLLAEGPAVLQMNWASGD